MYVYKYIYISCSCDGNMFFLMKDCFSKPAALGIVSGKAFLAGFLSSQSVRFLGQWGVRAGSRSDSFELQCCNDWDSTSSKHRKEI